MIVMIVIRILISGGHFLHNGSAHDFGEFNHEFSRMHTQYLHNMLSHIDPNDIMQIRSFLD